MKSFQADGERELIFSKLQSIYKKQGIAIRYAAPYIHKENELTKQGQRMIVTIKVSVLIDSGLPNNLWAKVMKTVHYLQNRLSTRSKNHKGMISEKFLTGKQQNLYHICIFGSLLLNHIPDKKSNKSYYQKVWKNILITYIPSPSSIFVYRHLRQNKLLLQVSLISINRNREQSYWAIGHQIQPQQNKKYQPEN